MASHDSGGGSAEAPRSILCYRYVLDE